jgi:hypothetical protein
MKSVSKSLRAASIAALFSFVLGSATVTEASSKLRCPQPLEPWDQISLFFGRNVDDLTIVSEEAFYAFLTEEVTPIFPDGLSVVNVAGQFLADDGEIIREQTNLLILLVPDALAVWHDIEVITESYKEKFDQQSVLQTVAPVCVAF